MERNKTTCVDRILSILDPDSFVEVGAYVGKKPDGSDLTGVVCCYGAVDGRLVYIFSQDVIFCIICFWQTASKKLRL